MANFTTRIVLHDANWEDYEELHEFMKKEGFERTITSDEGIGYQLPDAEYNFQGNVSSSQVLEKAKLAATQTKKKYSVLVSECTKRTWYNLDKL